MKKEVTNKQAALRDIARLHEREKSLLGYDLHDGIMQLIVGAKMNLEAVKIERLSEKDAQKVDDAKKYLADAISDLRNMIGDLRASAIESIAIQLELDSLIDRYRTPGRSVEFSADESIAELTSPICGAVYRIIQESLNNIMKHSQSTAVKIFLQLQNKCWRLCVADNGIGMSKGSFDAESQVQSFGVSGISFRAMAIGGKARFFSRALSKTEDSSEDSTSNLGSTQPLSLDDNEGTILFPLDQWRTDDADTNLLDINDEAFRVGTLVDVQWPNSV